MGCFKRACLYPLWACLHTPAFRVFAMLALALCEGIDKSLQSLTRAGYASIPLQRQLMSKKWTSPTLAIHRNDRQIKCSFGQCDGNTIPNIWNVKMFYETRRYVAGNSWNEQHIRCNDCSTRTAEIDLWRWNKRVIKRFPTMGYSLKANKQVSIAAY